MIGVYINFEFRDLLYLFKASLLKMLEGFLKGGEGSKQSVFFVYVEFFEFIDLNKIVKQFDTILGIAMEWAALIDK